MTSHESYEVKYRMCESTVMCVYESGLVSQVCVKLSLLYVRFVTGFCLSQ